MNPVFNLTLKKLAFQNNVSFFALLETRVQCHNKHRVIRGLGDCQSIDNYSHSHNGRIWILWDPLKFSVHCLQQSNQLVHCRVTRIDTNVSFLVTTIYALNTGTGREILWSDLLSIGNGVHEPWLIIGDLNTTLIYDERMKCGSFVDCDVSELQSVVNALDIKDLKYTGMRLTWCNNQDLDDRFFCKLDRALINQGLLDCFTQSEAPKVHQIITLALLI